MLTLKSRIITYDSKNNEMKLRNNIIISSDRKMIGRLFGQNRVIIKDVNE